MGFRFVPWKGDENFIANKIKENFAMAINKIVENKKLFILIYYLIRLLYIPGNDSSV